MKSLSGYLRSRKLNKRLEQPPVKVRQQIGEHEIVFSVHTWIEYHNRALLSYAGEPDMVDWLKGNLRPKDVLWDVGANVGAYSLLAAKMAPGALVIAFEPYIPTFAHLWENIVENVLARQIVPLCVALSDGTNLSELGISDVRAGSSEHVLGRKDLKALQPSLAIRGDEVCSVLGVPPPTLLKMDVDGYEMNVLQGMTSMLRDSALRTCIIEVQRGKTEEPVDKLMYAARFVRQSDSSSPAAGPTFNVIYKRGDSRGRKTFERRRAN